MNPTSLSDKDLLAMLIGTRRAERLYRGSLKSLLLEKGMSSTVKCKLNAAQELVRRILQEELKYRDAMSGPDKVHDYLRLTLGSEEQEVFMVLYLDAQHRLIEAKELFRGTLNQTNVYPREVVKYSLKHNAAAVILAHNHPSGVAEPSVEDRLTTKKLKESLRLVGVKVIDHVVVGGSSYLSFAEEGMI